MIRTRFAPSPTGELHVGGARTALFAYLFAKHNDGEFLLRIEDTDRERYVEGSIERIIQSLNWLGIIPQNICDYIVQSQRKDIYIDHALQLVKSGHAYVCTCSKERLEELRAEQEKKGLPPQYDRKCREVESEKLKVKSWEDLPKGSVIRLAMPLEGEIKFNDLVRGEVKFDLALQDDPVILKSDGFPTYHLASVVDDHEMKISHVIRAEEWLPSAPKHLILYKASGWKAPEFAHLPMILGPDRKKLSKRHGATSIMEYKKAGYLPEAFVNFMALLGWNPKNDREEFTIEQLIREFNLDNVNVAPAVFDIDKLNHTNEKYIQNRDIERFKIELAEFGLTDPTEGEVALAQRGGFQTLREIADYLDRLRQTPQYKPDLLIFKKSDKDKTQLGLKQARLALAGCDIWSAEELQHALTEATKDNNLANGDVFWPVRVALSGEEKSPSPIELLVALGRTESLKRIDSALEKLG